MKSLKEKILEKIEMVFFPEEEFEKLRPSLIVRYGDGSTRYKQVFEFLYSQEMQQKIFIKTPAEFELDLNLIKKHFLERAIVYSGNLTLQQYWIALANNRCINSAELNLLHKLENDEIPQKDFRKTLETWLLFSDQLLNHQEIDKAIKKM